MAGFLLPLAIAGGAGLAQGIATAAPSRYYKTNRERIEALQKQFEQDSFGLTGQERAALEREFFSPIQAAATEQRGRGEAMLAAGGLTSGADLSAIRREMGRTQAEGGQRAAAAVEQIAMGEKARQEAEAKAELESRQAAQEARRRDVLNAILGPIAQVAGAAGAAAAQPPDFYSANQMGYGDVKKALAAFGKDEAYIADVIAKDKGAPGYAATLIYQLGGVKPPSQTGTG